MFADTLVVVSLVLQFVTVYCALRLIKSTGFAVSWILISVSIFLMGIRRLITLLGHAGAAPGQSDIMFDLVGLVTSALMLGGVLMIAPLFEAMRRNADNMKALSLTDELTGLHNRRGLAAFAEQMMLRSERVGSGFYLLYADLDGMKKINDTFGHKEGDVALKATADILKKTFRKSDIVARVGGDEFVVAPAGYAGDDMSKVAGRLQKMIDGFNAGKGARYTLSLSLGFSYYDPVAPCTFEQLLLQGDRMMYEDKNTKKNAT